MSNHLPIIGLDSVKALQAFRDITNSRSERTFIVNNIPFGPIGNNAPVITHQHSMAVSYALVLGNMNSLPLDWAARISVGGTHMSFFVVKQLPVLSPEEYLKDSPAGLQYVQLIIPRVLQLTYTSIEMAGFASDLGFEGPPFRWDEELRHKLQCELDAIFAHMYQLSRKDLEWILDAPPPSSSFTVLKKNELNKFGEYRTKRYVLLVFDALHRGEMPTLCDTYE